MPEKTTGIEPDVNKAHEFLQIAENFEETLEIIREALSNSWDAGASDVEIIIDRDTYKTPWSPIITIRDNGNGMDGKKLQDFFSLGFSEKPKSCIGTKGHGTKIYYRSDGIHVETVNNGKKIIAETERPPYETLRSGKLPTYWKEVHDNFSGGNGTKITITRFSARPRDFQKVKDEIIPYIRWYTIGGSFEHYFNRNARKMNITVHNEWEREQATIDNWFKIPDENLTADTSTKLCKVFPTEILEGESEENHVDVSVNILACLIGEEIREQVVQDRKEMGLWLAKDFIKIERMGEINFQVGDKTGEFYFSNFLVLANCQQLNLPANRDSIQRDEIYETVIKLVKEYIKQIGNNSFTTNFFAMKKREQKEEDDKRRMTEREETKKQLDERMKAYQSRDPLPKIPGLNGAIIKTPKNEKETLLLLQAMISSNIKNIDFVIGEYDDYKGVDSIIEFDDKGTHRLGWLEMVHELSKIKEWWHFNERTHKIVCWDIGNLKPGKYELQNKKIFEYEKRGNEHFIKYEEDFIKVYVLKEILETFKK
jgi:hypothetical protein